MTQTHFQMIMVVILFAGAIFAYYPTRRYVSIITSADRIVCYSVSAMCFLGALTMTLIVVGIL